jgi:outer membrane protease
MRKQQLDSSRQIQRLALVGVGLIFCAVLASAQDVEKAFTISTRSTAGLLCGQAEEYVYNQDWATDYKNSELDWPFEPLFYVGEGIDLSTTMGLFASLDVKEGLPGKTGEMTDSDYLNGDGARTNFSQSDSDTERMVIVDLKLGYNLPFDFPVKVGAYVGFSYMDIKWSAQDGYYQYPTSGQMYGWYNDGTPYNGTYADWSADETKTPIYGTSILYETAYLEGSLGFRASYILVRNLSVGGFFSFSPVVYCYTEDNHELREVNFYSTLKNGLSVEPGLSISYTIKPGASLSLSASYKTVWNLKGDLTEVNQGSTSTSSYSNYYAGPDSSSTGANDSSAAISMLDASLSFTMAY